MPFWKPPKSAFGPFYADVHDHCVWTDTDGNNGRGPLGADGDADDWRTGRGLDTHVVLGACALPHLYVSHLNNLKCNKKIS